MKLKLLTVAVATALAGAAQADHGGDGQAVDVNVFGNLNAGVSAWHIDRDSGSEDTTTDVISSDTFLGFAASTNAGGNEFFVRFEQGINLTESGDLIIGNGTGLNNFNDKEQHIGVRTGWGTVKIGNTRTPSANVTSYTDRYQTFGRTDIPGGGLFGTSRFNDEVVTNSLTYESPKVADLLSFEAQVAHDGDNGDDSDHIDTYEVAGYLETGAVNVGVAYWVKPDRGGANDNQRIHHWAAGGSFAVAENTSLNFAYDDPQGDDNARYTLQGAFDNLTASLSLQEDGDDDDMSLLLGYNCNKASGVGTFVEVGVGQDEEAGDKDLVVMANVGVRLTFGDRGRSHAGVVDAEDAGFGSLNANLAFK